MSVRPIPGNQHTHLAFWLLLLTALGLGCQSETAVRAASEPSQPDRLVLNSSPPPISVRYRLAPSDVELAILLAIGDPPQVPALAPGEEITDDVLPAVLGGSTNGPGGFANGPGGFANGPGGSTNGRGGAANSRRADHPWSFAKREPGLIFSSYERGQFSMRVAIMFDQQLVMLRIVESRNLGQSGDRIRQSAFSHLAELESRIRRNIEAVAQRNWYGTPVPASR